jgi:hypothetical protein
MADASLFPRSVLRRAEKTELSLGSLEAIVELRKTLDRLEHEAILSAREKGATVQDIADVLGVTAPAIYYRLRSGDGQPTGRRGQPKKLESPPDTLGKLDLRDAGGSGRLGLADERPRPPEPLADPLVDSDGG